MIAAAHHMPRLSFPRPLVEREPAQPLPDAYRTVIEPVRKAKHVHVIRGLWA